MEWSDCFGVVCGAVVVIVVACAAAYSCQTSMMNYNERAKLCISTGGSWIPASGTAMCLGRPAP